ncbi:hypothetical protein [Kordia jejudonensis]|uniref:hypothetical protein n=1 Tax=Kordia jejudonensis TaxID=1348245 RepID=UPI0006297A78|nr:hypothetical protein [Kordia jejudonensis]
MKKKLLTYILLAPLLMAFQCEEDELQSTLTYNTYKVNVTMQSNFSVDETIWINGRVSSKAFDTAVNDSIFSDIAQSDTFSIYKFIEPTAVSNCKDAIDKFELIFDSGSYSFLPSCENAQIHAIPELESSELFFSYRIGLKAIEPGDYVISWQDAAIQNTSRNESIVDNYPIENHPNQIGFNRCENVSWRFLNESQREFYFTVE